MSLNFKPRNILEITVYSDGCPEDCLQDPSQGLERWHTITYVAPPLHDVTAYDLCQAMRKHDAYFRLRHWHDGGRQSRPERNDKKKYRKCIADFILEEMFNTNISAFAWSFQEKSVWASRKKLFDEFKISKHDILSKPTSKGGTKLLYTKWRHLGWIQEREFMMILMMADSIATAHRDTIKSPDGMPLDKWRYITDNISGDPGGPPSLNPRGFLLAKILDRRHRGVFTVSYIPKEQESMPWLLLADNLAGYLNGILNKMFTTEVPRFGDPDQKPLQWNWTDEEFQAYQITGPKRKPPWQTTGVGK